MTVTIDIYEGRQSLRGVLIDPDHEPKLRVNIERDSYDDQSHARVEAWTSEGGWKVIRNVPIVSLPIASHSYTEPRRDDVTWRVTMQHDLYELCNWARLDFYKEGT